MAIAAKDPRRDKHHFLARHLLQHFTAADDLLHVYDRSSGWAMRRDIPQRLAAEKFLYAPEVSDDQGRDPKDDTVERWLADEIDRPAAKPIDALAKGAELKTLSADDLHAIADFIALLDMRTPAVRDLLTPAFFGVAQRAMEDRKQTRKGLLKQGLHVTSGEIGRIGARHNARLAKEFAKPAWLSYLQNTRQIARINVKARSWRLVRAPVGCEFITNDLGVAKSLLGPLEPASWEPGTALGRAHWIVPICPETALALTPRHAPVPVSSEALVLATNQQLIQDARRYVYSRGEVDASLLANAPAARGNSGTAPSTV